MEWKKTSKNRKSRKKKKDDKNYNMSINMRGKY